MAVCVEAAAAVCPAMILIAPGSAVGIPAGSLSNEQADRKINDAQRNFFIVLPLYSTVYDTLHARYHDPGVGNLSQINGSTTDYFLTDARGEDASTMAHTASSDINHTLGRASITSCMLICGMVCSSPLLKMYIANLLNAGEAFIDRTENFTDGRA